MTDIKKVPIRSSFVTRAVTKCWRLAKLEIVQPQEKKPYYMLGGQMFAILVENWFGGSIPDSMDNQEASLVAWRLAMEEGSYSCSDEQRALVINRCAEGFEEFKSWWAESGLVLFACEIEVRTESSGGRDVAIKIDLLCLRDDKKYLLDIKTWGMWGKSISSSEVTDLQMRQSLQLSMYAYFLERGGEMYVGHNISRTESNASVRSRLKPISGKIKPDFVGYISIAHLTRRRRTTKNGRKGDRRGPGLYTMPYDPSMAEYAEEQIRACEIMITFNQFPRTSRYEKGVSSCMGCAYTNDCWSGRATPNSAPSWLAKKRR